MNALPDSFAPVDADQMVDAPRWPSRLLLLAVLASMATLLGLAWLWLMRNPMLSSWDEVMHLNLSMADGPGAAQRQPGGASVCC